MNSNYDEDNFEFTDLKEKIMWFAEVSKYTSFFEITTNENISLHVTIVDDPTINKIEDKIIEKKNLVMLHGLSSSGLFFYKLFKDLSKYFTIYAIDLPGMGCSSRDDHETKDYHEYEDYFLSNIKICLDKLSIFEFVLIGHSLGAYISSLFTLKFTNMIKGLILLSPVGLSCNYANIASTRLEDFLQTVSFKFHTPPSNQFKSLGVFSSVIFNFLFVKKMKGVHDEVEIQTLKEFMKALFNRKTSSEYSIFSFFNKNLQAYKPINYFSEILKEKKILILYGKDDWSPVSHAEELKELLEENVEIQIVPEGGHNMFLDNSIETNVFILDFLIKNNILEKL